MYIGTLKTVNFRKKKMNQRKLYQYIMKTIGTLGAMIENALLLKTFQTLNITRIKLRRLEKDMTKLNAVLLMV